MISVGLIGCGAIARTHARAFARFSSRCRVVSLCDIYPEKAEALRGEQGWQAAVHRDLARVLADPSVDLVSLCLPPSLHAEVTIAALEAGKHVLCEKPMAASLADCDAMIAAQERSSRLLSVVAQNRFRTPMMKMKALLAEGVAGRILHAQVNSWWWRGQSYYDLWWRGTWEKEGGGCTLNHAVHHIDLLHWLRGMPAEVLSVMANTNHENSEVEDLAIAILRHGDGTLSQATASLVHHGEDQELMFQGERAGLWIPFKVKAGVSKENGFPVEDTATVRAIQARYDALPEVAFEGHEGQIDNVLSALETGAPLLIDGVEGRKTIELITAIYESAVAARPVRVPFDPGDPCYTTAGLLARMPRFHGKKRSIENFASSSITLGSNPGR